MKKEINRRNFMRHVLGGASLLTSNPMQLFMGSMMTNFINQGIAHAAGEVDPFSDYKFINFFMGGGTPRWYWDLPLRPNGDSDPFVQNKSAITNFSGEKALYDHVKIGDVYLPYLWNSLIPTSGGTFIPMSMLAQNFMTIRGLNLLVDSHDICSEKQLSPVPGVSLLGAVADRSVTPIPASGNNGMGFKSNKGRSFMGMGGGNPFTDGLRPFLADANMLSIQGDNVESAIDQVLNAMKSSSSSYHKFLPVTYEDRVNAKALMKRNFGNLQEQYNTLYRKYSTLITLAMTDVQTYLPGLNNLGLEGKSSPEFNLHISGATGQYLGSDISKMVLPGVGGLAESMSIAEFMITQGYSTCMGLGIGGPSMNMDRGTINGSAVTNRQIALEMDQHFQGSYPSLITRSAQFKAMAACFYELIDALKSVPSSAGGTVFDRTVISLTSDFNRTARADGGGSDHGWQGSNYTLFSGMIPGPVVLGNIQSDSSANYAGTWGKAAPMAELGGRDTIIGNVMSTICTMVETPSIMPNDISYVKKVGSKIIPVVGKPKNFGA